MLSKRLGDVDGAVYNYDNEASLDPMFPKLLMRELSSIKGTIEFLEIAFLKDADRKKVLRYEETMRLSIAREGRFLIPKQMEGRQKLYLHMKRMVQDIYYAVRLRFESLSKVFKDKNYFEVVDTRLRAEDIPED